MQRVELEKDLYAQLLAALKVGRESTCRELCELALMLYPEDPVWLYTYGERLRRLGQTLEAEQVLTRALTVVSDKSRWLVEVALGQIHENTGRYPSAETWFTRATRSNPEGTSPWIYLGSFLTHRERFDDAREALRRATRATGNVDEAFLNLGMSHRRQGDLLWAKSFVEKALEITPDYPAAREVIEDIAEALRVRQQLRPLVEEAARADSDADEDPEED